MRRHKHLFEKLISFENLLKAAKLAQRGKRSKINTAQFNFNLESEIWNLQKELADGAYRPGRYHLLSRLWHFTKEANSCNLWKEQVGVACYHYSLHSI